MSWPVGTRVQWHPDGKSRLSYGALVTGVIADAPRWPAIDSRLADGERLPIDLDPPITLPAHMTSRPYTVARLWVREQFLEERA